jgi:hypothetical protein
MRGKAGLGAFLFLTTILVACSGAPGDDATGNDQALSDAKKKDAGADSGTKDAGGGGGGGAQDSGSGDGTPVRKACSGSFGRGLSGSFGRLDGYVVSIVPRGGSKTCNGDSTHVHMQVSMQGALYDVAVNVDGGYLLEKNIPLPDGAWSEGWHPSDGLDYSKTLGLKSTDFTSVPEATLTTELENALASVNHISVFGSTYTGSDSGSGIHDIHRQSTNHDGAIFLDPTSAIPQALLFRFSTDSF